MIPTKRTQAISLTSLNNNRFTTTSNYKFQQHHHYYELSSLSNSISIYPSAIFTGATLHEFSSNFHGTTTIILRLDSTRTSFILHRRHLDLVYYQSRCRITSIFLTNLFIMIGDLSFLAGVITGHNDPSQTSVFPSAPQISQVSQRSWYSTFWILDWGFPATRFQSSFLFFRHTSPFFETLRVHVIHGLTNVMSI